MNCPSCGADLPADARFCIECGLGLPKAATDATVKLPARQAAMACRACGAPNPADAIFCVRCGRRHAEPVFPRLEAPAPIVPAPLPRRASRRRPSRAGFALPAILLIGLGVFILVGKTALWPLLFILLGVSAFVREANRGRPNRGLSIMFWVLGLVVAFTLPRLFFPAILLALGATILLNATRRP